MNKDKQDFYTGIVLLTFFISVLIISISLDFGAYMANSRAVELVNQDISYLKDMQLALPNIPSLEKIIFTQECNSILISLVQSTFLLSVSSPYCFSSIDCKMGVTSSVMC